MSNNRFYLFLTFFQIYFTKRLLYVDSSASDSGSGLKEDDPLNNIRDAFSELEGDLEIVLTTSYQPYVIDRFYVFSGTFKLISYINPKPILIISASGSFCFLSNVTIANLVLTSRRSNTAVSINHVLLQFKGEERTFDISLMNLELIGIGFKEGGGFIAGTTSGNFFLSNLNFNQIGASSNNTRTLMNFTQCKNVIAKNFSFISLSLANYKIMELNCPLILEKNEISFGNFSSSEFISLISVMSNLVNLTNMLILNNSFTGFTLLSTLNDSCLVLMTYASISNNIVLGDADAFLLLSTKKNANIYFLHSIIKHNHANVDFFVVASLDCKIKIANVTFEQNTYPICLNIKGPNLMVSISDLAFIKNNDISMKTPLNFIGQAISIEDFVSISIKLLTLLFNTARNTLQGLMVVQNKQYLYELNEKCIETTVIIDEFICKGNRVFQNKSPINIGNCANFHSLEKATIVASLFESNESELNPGLTIGASSPCLFSFGIKTELLISHSSFEYNKGYDGCHCVTYVGEKLMLLNVKFANLGSSKVEESIFNEAGALSVGARLFEINQVLITSCKSNKAAGIFFQNYGNKQMIKVFSDGLVIKLNKAKQSAGLAFDVTLYTGNYSFNNTVIDSNSVEFYGVVAFSFKSFNNITFTNSIFVNNKGILAGAVFTILYLQGEFHIIDCNFINNTLLGNKVFLGGSVALVIGSTAYTSVNFHRCQFKRNFCTTHGGVLRIEFGRIKINDSVFESNSASYGGCIVTGYDTILTVFRTIFMGGFQDVEIKEGAGIFVKDLTLTSLIECEFKNLKAVSGVAVSMVGFVSFLEAYSCKFIANIVKEGNLIYLFNRYKGQAILMQDILLIDNRGVNTHLYFQNILTYVINLTASGNTGKIFTLVNANLTLESFFIIDHKCDFKLDQGCFCSAFDKTQAKFLGGIFLNLFSTFQRDYFFLTESSVIINTLEYANVTSNAEFCLANAYHSNLTLVALKISNLFNNLIFLEKSKFNLNTSSFFNISQKSKYKYGAIQCFACELVLVCFNNFTFITTDSIGGILYLKNGKGDSASYRISNNIFDESAAFSGGVLFAEDQSLEFVDNTASQINAIESGGVVYLKASKNVKIIWTIKGNDFISNHARRGGCIHSQGLLPQGLMLNIYKYNKAEYGKDYSSFPAGLSLVSDLSEESNSSNEVNSIDTIEKCTVKNVGSGLRLENIYLSLIDTYGQKMFLEEALGTIEIAFKQKYSQDFRFFEMEISKYLVETINLTVLKGQKTVRANNGMFNFSELTLVATPNSKVLLVVKTNSIADFRTYQHTFNPSACEYFSSVDNQYNFLIVAWLRNCSRGEIYIAEENICFPCPEGKYSLDPNDKACTPCPKNAMCEGGDRIIVDHGYWRSSVNSVEIWQCNEVSDPCLGGYESKCKRGYASTVCGSCEYSSNSTKFFKNGLFYCFPCEDLFKYIITLICGVLATLILLGFLIWYKQRYARNIKEGAFIKLLVSHLQVNSYISNIKITLPDILQNFYNIHAPLTTTETFVFAIDCFRDRFPIPVFAVKLLISVGIKVFLISLICFVYLIIKKRTGVSLRETLINILNSLVIVAMFLQPLFINFYSQMISCVTYDSSFMMNYLDQKCWEGHHLYFSVFVTIPLLFFWIFVFPGSFLFYLFRNRKRLDDKMVLRISIYFRAGYKANLYFWDFVIMSRKFFVIIITSFFGQNTEFVIYVLIPIIAFYCALQMYIRPYVQNKFNLLEIFSLNATFITYYAAVFYHKIVSENIRLSLIFIIIGVNAAFFLFWLHQYCVKIASSTHSGLLSSGIFKGLEFARKKQKQSLATRVQNSELPKVKCNFNITNIKLEDH